MTTNEENDQINNNNNIIGNISYTDLSKIRNEFLVSIKQVQRELTKKFDEQNKILTSSISDIKEKIIEFPKMNSSLTEATANITIILDKIDDIESFKKKAEAQLITHDIRLNNTIKDLADSKYKYDKIFIDNLTLPGFIGPQSQYKTLSDYIYNNIQVVTNLSTLKDQMKDDLDFIKSKYENMNNDITILVGTIIDRCNNYSDNKDKNLEDELKSEIKSNSEKIVEIRMQNAKDAILFDKKNKELKDELNNILSIKSEFYNKNMELKEQLDNILSLKDDIENKLNSIVESNNKENNSNNFIQKFEQLNFEFVKIKSNVENILKFINDLKTKNNINKNIKKNYKEKLKKSSFDVESYNDSNKVISDEEEEFDKKEKMHQLFHKISKKRSFDDNEETDEKYNKNENIGQTHSINKISNEDIQNIDSASKKLIKDSIKLKNVNTNIQIRNNSNSENLMINSLFNRVGNNKVKENNNSKYETLITERNVINQQSFKQIENNDILSNQNIKKKNINNTINNNNNNLRNSISNEKKIDYFQKAKNKYKKDIYLNIERQSSPTTEEKQKNEQIQINDISHNNNYNIYNQNSRMYKIKYYHRPSNSVVINTNSNNINNKYYVQDQNTNEKINPLNIKHKKNYYQNNQPKEYDRDFNFNIIEVELEPKNNPQNLFIFKSIKSEKNINDNILGNQNKRRRQSVNNNMKFTKTFSPQGFHKEIIDCYGTTVYKKNINFNEQFPPSRNKLKTINLLNPI